MTWSDPVDIDNFNIGNSSVASFTLDDAQHNTVTTLTLGANAGGDGTYTLEDGTLTVGDIVNGAGSSTFNMNSGTLNFTGTSVDVDTFVVGKVVGSNARFTLASGQSLTAHTEVVGASGTGIVTQDGGSHRVNRTLALGVGAGASGTYAMNGGSLTVGTSLVGGTGAGTFTMAGGHLSVASLHTDAANGGVDFNFSGGMLAVDTVIGDLVNQGGTLAPGNSPEVTTINGNYTQTLAGIFTVELGGLLSGTEYDVLNVTGIANLGGTLRVDWYDLGSGLFGAALGDSFDILTAETLTGEFDLLSLVAVARRRSLH